ncbi:outer membrane beta-barrel protein [Pedobacter sp. N23S346]|uniref:outer membrane beta-barrel protein n=1 Tax=Pedobacter sp. N23S346 TaxID=3402750 RepID=UPI003ACC0B36
MKKQLLTIAVLCAVAFTVNAQTEKGDNLIGGSISYSSDKRTPENLNNLTSQKSTNISITPRFGHFVSNNVAIGLSVGYIRSKNFYESNLSTPTSILIYNTESTNETFNIGPFVRYYVNIVDKFKFFGQGNAFFAFGKSVSVDGGSITVIPRSTKYKTTIYGAAINPGFAFFPTKRWAFEFSFPLVSYNNYKMKDDGNNVSSQAYQNEGFQFGFDSFNPSIGLNYHF